MNPLHLLWIIPTAFISGYVVSSMFITGKLYDEECNK